MAEIIAFQPPKQREASASSTSRRRPNSGLTKAQRLEAIQLLQDFAAQMGLVITVRSKEEVS